MGTAVLPLASHQCVSAQARSGSRLARPIYGRLLLNRVVHTTHAGAPAALPTPGAARKDSRGRVCRRAGQHIRVPSAPSLRALILTIDRVSVRMSRNLETLEEIDDTSEETDGESPEHNTY